MANNTLKASEIKHPLADGTIVLLRGDPEGKIYGGDPLPEEHAKILGHEIKRSGQVLYCMDNLEDRGTGNGYADSVFETAQDGVIRVWPLGHIYAPCLEGQCDACQCGGAGTCKEPYDPEKI